MKHSKIKNVSQDLSHSGMSKDGNTRVARPLVGSSIAAKYIMTAYDLFLGCDKISGDERFTASIQRSASTHDKFRKMKGHMRALIELG